MRSPPGARLLIAALLLAAWPASAQSSPELEDMYVRGNYLAAASAAEAAADPDNRAFAARALLAFCFTEPAGPDPAIVDRASKNAEAALGMNPSHEEGRLQLAIALSLKSRAMDPMDVWNRGYGEKSRKLATDVLRSDPDNSYAHGFLAVWNLEVRRRAGSFSSAFMGASVKEAQRQYQKAARLAPDFVGIHWSYARALVALDAKEYAEEANRALSAALSASADDYVEEVMQARAQVLAETLRNDPKAAQTLARKIL